ncbi:MAG: phage portal protein [Enterocloster bolteae]
MLATTRKRIFEQGQGIDPDPQNFGNSSGVALGFLYSLLELKAGLMETEFKIGFGRSHPLRLPGNGHTNQG